MGIIESVKLVLLMAVISTVIFFFAITFVVVSQEVHPLAGILFFALIAFAAYKILAARLTKL